MGHDKAKTGDTTRRTLLLGSGVAIATLASSRQASAASSAAMAHAPVAEPVAGPYPTPPKDRSAGPILPGRGSTLSGKIAVVTGAARGIGRAIAVEFAANGADVVALDIAGPVSPTADAIPATDSELSETVAQIQKYGRRGAAVKADIRDIAALRRVADQVEREYGKIDIVVANAAIQGWKPLMQMDDMDWRDQIENNLNGTANTIRAFGPRMVARKYGRLILLSSMQGRMGTKDGASYSASKWGILGLMKSAALELGQHNITVNAILPGLVGTPLTYNEQRFRAAIEQSNRTPTANPTAREAWEARAPTVPLQVGWLQPEDISPVAVFLASDAAALVTGAEFAVTGGDAAKAS
ncbi:SDR family oxidoreductase [Mesorhizobium sp. Cs1299R1N1]|uniref:SDR family NAD(P)-dependent oxidoreductase n=1 Tax=Mesorhizobium sp. Cs1299R1N1 TaxID=3015172 RepID=UPI00301D5FC6